MLKSIVKRRVYRKEENEEVVTCLKREKREKWRIKGKKDRHEGDTERKQHRMRDTHTDRKWYRM